MPFRTLFPALPAAAGAFHPKLRPRAVAAVAASTTSQQFSLNDLKARWAARGSDVSGMTEKAEVAEALKAPRNRTPPRRTRTTTHRPPPLSNVAHGTSGRGTHGGGRGILDETYFEARPINQWTTWTSTRACRRTRTEVAPASVK